MVRAAMSPHFLTGCFFSRMQALTQIRLWDFPQHPCFGCGQGPRPRTKIISKAYTALETDGVKAEE